jgi:hypothetical protein
MSRRYKARDTLSSHTDAPTASMPPPLKYLAASGPEVAEKQATELAKIANGKHGLNLPFDVLLKMVNIGGLEPGELLDPACDFITYEFCQNYGMKEAQIHRLLRARQDIQDGNAPSKTRR